MTSSECLLVLFLGNIDRTTFWFRSNSVPALTKMPNIFPMHTGDHLAHSVSLSQWYAATWSWLLKILAIPPRIFEGCAEIESEAEQVLDKTRRSETPDKFG